MTKAIDKTTARSQLEQALSEALKAANSDPNVLSKRLTEMIRYATGRVDYYERYRTTYQTIAMGLIGAALAIASLVLKPPVSQFDWKMWFIVASILSLLLGGTGILHIYSEGTAADYPYLQVADTKSWRYIHSLPPSDRSSRNGRESEVQEYCKEFTQYLQTWVRDASSPTVALLEDIEQVYTLFRLQQFKRDSAPRMSAYLQYIFTVAVILMLIGLLGDQIVWILQRFVGYFGSSPASPS